VNEQRSPTNRAATYGDGETFIDTILLGSSERVQRLDCLLWAFLKKRIHEGEARRSV
jgi:hypothetical protein